MKHGISFWRPVGLGDAIQFTSLPENYYRHTGKKLIDTTHHWCFDRNPFVVRGVKPDHVHELWDRHKKIERPSFFLSEEPVGPPVWLSNAEHHCALLDIPVSINRPRLYAFEDFPIEKREMILLHTHGKSHGTLPDPVIDHVLKKYKKTPLYHIGLPEDPDLGIPKIPTPTLDDLAKVISQCRMFIGVDSGPSWVAACYPDVVIKKVRTRPKARYFKTWVALEMSNIHSHWDDRMFQIFNPTEDDLGFTWSYKRI